MIFFKLSIKKLFLVITVFAFFLPLLFSESAIAGSSPTDSITYPSKCPFQALQECDGPGDDCVFNLSVTFAFNSNDDGQNVTKAEYAIGPGAWIDITQNCGQIPAPSGTCTFNFSRNVGCPGIDDFFLYVRVTDADGTGVAVCWFKLTCREKQKQVGITPGFPIYPQPYSNENRDVTCCYGLINTDSLNHMYQLSFDQSLTWITYPSSFPDIFLASAEDTTLYFDVTIPGGTPITTENFFYLTVSDYLDPPTTNSDTSSIIICENIPTLNEWGMILLALLLLAIGTIAVIRRRRATAAREM